MQSRMMMIQTKHTIQYKEWQICHPSPCIIYCTNQVTSKTRISTYSLLSFIDSNKTQVFFKKSKNVCGFMQDNKNITGKLRLKLINVLLVNTKLLSIVYVHIIN